jgi:hypothetical protein
VSTTASYILHSTALALLQSPPPPPLLIILTCLPPCSKQPRQPFVVDWGTHWDSRAGTFLPVPEDPPGLLARSPVVIMGNWSAAKVLRYLQHGTAAVPLADSIYSHRYLRRLVLKRVGGKAPVMIC